MNKLPLVRLHRNRLAIVTAKRSRFRATLAFILALMLFRAAHGQTQDTAWEQTRRVAEAEHEIVALLIRQNNFDQVRAEMRKVYALKFPGQYEWMLSQEIEIVANALMNMSQFDIAHQVIDEGLVSLKVGKNQAAVLKKKAYILKKQGKDKEALQYFKQAVELESGKR
ncbi:MAG: tetratricopeptide repeat protein [Acidobacteria bacterium]|nr:tetratricopeptide repeat protein [Acidobacteriota bacterium]